VPRSFRTAPEAMVALSLALAVAGCAGDAPVPSAPDGSRTPTRSPASSGMALADLSAIGCASDDPAGEGELTGAWAGNDRGVYYIRQVGECVWWFGTEVADVELGAVNQRGFANVASGRLAGTRLDVEWADVPLGDTVNGGGLTFLYDSERGELTLTEQRGGGIPFGGTVLTRIPADATASRTPSPTASPTGTP
jgi:hypothetical protein